MSTFTKERIQEARELLEQPNAVFVVEGPDELRAALDEIERLQGTLNVLKQLSELLPASARPTGDNKP